MRLACACMAAALCLGVLPRDARAQVDPPPVPAQPLPPPADKPAEPPAPAPAPGSVDSDGLLGPAEPPPAQAASSPGDPEELLSPGTAGPAAPDSGLADGADAVETTDGPPLDARSVVLSLPSLLGPVGLYRVSAADTGRVKQLRLGFRGEFFRADDVLVEFDQDVRLQGSLALGYTPIENLEIFGAFLGGSNQNRRLCMNGSCRSEANRRDPEVIKAFGDIVLGGKYGYTPASGVRIAGELYLRLLSSITGITLDPDATSVSMNAIGTFDARAWSELPVRGHINAGYYVDNSSNLQNYTNVSAPSQLVSSFAYGIARSRFRGSLAVDVPLPEINEDVLILPFAEYHVEVVTGKMDQAFADYAPPLCGQPGALRCHDNRHMQWLALGVRALLWKRVALDLGVESALVSVGFPYGPPLPPYNIVFGATLPLDLDTFGRSRVVTRTVTVDKVAAPTRGVVTGSVVSSQGGTPLPNAVVAAVGMPHSRVATDPDGGFTTHELPAGELDLEISATGFEPQVIRAEVAAGMSTDVQVALVPQVVAIPDAQVSGRITNTAGQSIQATVRFSGPRDETVNVDATGRYSVTLPPGSYKATAESDRFFRRSTRFSIEGGSASNPPSADTTVDFSLRPRPLVPTVKVGPNRLILRRSVRFQAGTATLTRPAQGVLDEVADVMLRDPGIQSVEIETHWDSKIGREQAMTLTEQQADAVIDYLREQGVALDRLRAVPKGATKPVAPNVGKKNIAKNRRVMFRITRGGE